jgi:hypothetical protein
MQQWLTVQLTALPFVFYSLRSNHEKKWTNGRFVVILIEFAELFVALLILEIWIISIATMGLNDWMRRIELEKY